MSYLQRAADAGDVQAMAHLGNMLANGLVSHGTSCLRYHIVSALRAVRADLAAPIQAGRAGAGSGPLFALGSDQERVRTW